MSFTLMQEIYTKLIDFDPGSTTQEKIKSYFPNRTYGEVDGPSFFINVLLIKIDSVNLRLDFDREVVLWAEDYSIRNYARSDRKTYRDGKFSLGKYPYGEFMGSLEEIAKDNNISVPLSWLDWTEDDFLLFRMSI